MAAVCPDDGTVAAPQRTHAIARAGWAASATGSVAASLITFPNGVPWMVAGWLLWHTWRVMRGRPTWIPLATCLVLLLAKGSELSPGMVLLMIVFGLTAVLYALRLRRWSERIQRPLVRLGTIVCWLAWAVLLLDWHRTMHQARPVLLSASRPIVCLGDSLTAFGYPRQLAARLSVPVVDMGCNGITTADALDMLSELKAHRPQAVIIELGGHDFLRGFGRGPTRKNLEAIITASRSVGAEVVLMEIPRGVVRDPFHGLERGLAREYDLELIPDTLIRRLVFWSPFAPPGMWLPRDQWLSDDGLHPNERGNRVLADGTAAALERLFGPAVLRSSALSDGR